MEKRFQMTAEGIVVSALIVLSESQKEKLECKDLERTITNIAKDLHVDWAVETSGNISTATVSKVYGPVVGEAQAREVEIAAHNFMAAVDKLQTPCDKHLMKVQDVDDAEYDDTVVVFTVGNNAARVIKALRECTCATLETAKNYAKNGRIVCAKDEAQGIIDNLEVAGAKDVHIDEKLTNNLVFCKDFIDNWEDEESTGFVCGADVICAFKDTPGLFAKCGQISGDLLKDMFIAYIQSM